MSAIIGIDPGKGVGIVMLSDDGGAKPIVYKMPETERDLWDLFAEMKQWGATRAVLELVRSSPQMGVVSAFTFGRGLGGLRMALIGHGIPFEEVTPHKWRTAIGLPKNASADIGSKGAANKNASKAKAQELFPTVKVTHALADALLLAEYGRRASAVGGRIAETAAKELGA